MSCIELLTLNDENGFKCSVCDDFHEKPQKGYLKNANLAKLCAMKANEATLSPLAETLRVQLGEMKLNLDKLDKDNKLGADKIKEHCDGLRNEVQLSSEELIESINKCNMELIEKINEYEKESIKNFSQGNATRLDNFIQEVNEFHAERIGHLKEFKSDDNDLITASNQVNEFLEQIKKENEQFLFKLFNDDLVQFNKNRDGANPSTIGTLTKADNSYSNNNLVGLYKYDLCNLSSFNQHGPVCVKFLKNGKVSAAYRIGHQNDVGIGVFDKKLNVLHERKCRTGRHFESFQLNAMANSSILLCLINPDKTLNNYNNKSDDEDSCADYTDTKSVIKQFDDKLKKINRVCLDYVVTSIDTYDNKIFCLSAGLDSVVSSLHIYDDKLVHLGKIYGSNENEPFYMPYPVDKVQVCESFFVFRDEMEIILLDKSNGWVQKRLDIEYYHYHDYLFSQETNSLMWFCNEADRVISYDFDGNLQTMDVNISNPNKRINIVDRLNEKLLFLDSSLNCFYVFRN
jgi:hypothetical protein